MGDIPMVPAILDSNHPSSIVVIFVIHCLRLNSFFYYYYYLADDHNGTTQNVEVTIFLWFLYGK